LDSPRQFGYLKNLRRQRLHCLSNPRRCRLFYLSNFRVHYTF